MKTFLKNLMVLAALYAAVIIIASIFIGVAYIVLEVILVLWALVVVSVITLLILLPGWASMSLMVAGAVALIGGHVYSNKREKKHCIALKKRLQAEYRAQAQA